MEKADKKVGCGHVRARFFLGDEGPLCALCVLRAEKKFWEAASRYYEDNGFSDNCWYNKEDK